VIRRLPSGSVICFCYLLRRAVALACRLCGVQPISICTSAPFGDAEFRLLLTQLGK